jgi:multiple sugar transport system ATP-binding protein
VAGVALKEIGKTFGRTPAVRNVTLEIADKKFVVLVGPSGCGKTTVLRLVAGLEQVTTGEIYIGGRRVNDVAPKDRNVAMVFQNYALYPHMDVYKNLAVGLQLRKLPAREIDARVREAAAMLGLGDLLDRKPAALSGGERQRVAMGRAIVRKPDLFLFDEPLSNLDAKLRIRMRAEIKQLHARLQTTVIYVTHDQTEAMTLADEIVIMNRGAVMQRGAPLEVFNNPKNLFVAGFMGAPSMNFARVRVAGAEGALRLTADGIELPLPADRFRFLSSWSRGELVLGVRPEHILPKQGGSQETGGAIEGVVELYEHLGTQTLIHLAVGDQKIVALADAARLPPANTRARFSVDPENIRLFDPATEAALS